MEKQELIEKLSAPFIDGKEVKAILIQVLLLSKSKARKTYHGMREKYIKEAKERKVIVFGTQLPTNFTLTYLESMGVSKEYILTKATEDLKNEVR